MFHLSAIVLTHSASKSRLRRETWRDKKLKQINPNRCCCYPPHYGFAGNSPLWFDSTPISFSQHAWLVPKFPSADVCSNVFLASWHRLWRTRLLLPTSPNFADDSDTRCVGIFLPA